MAVLALYKDFESGKSAVIGYVCERNPGQYWFNPRLPHRQSSRKDYDTPEKAIPRWAMQMADRIEAA